MLQDGPSTCRYRAVRKRASGGVDGVGRTARLRHLALIFVVALAWRPSSVLAQTDCGGGVEGILSGDGTTCCLLACGLCGGSGCSDVEGLSDTDCCVNDISNTGRTCAVDGVGAPCTIDPANPLTTPAPVAATAAPVAPPTSAPVAPPVAAPVAPQTAAPVPAPIADPNAPLPGSVSTCENGYPGWQTQEACCSEFCGQCGGSGCGALGSADCCFDNIVNGDRVCEVNAFEAPCIIIDLTPAPLAEGQTFAPVPAPTPPPSTAPVAPTAPTMAAPVTPPMMTTATEAPVGGATEAPVSREVEVPTPAPADGTASEAPVEPAGTPAPTVALCAEGLEGFRHGNVCCAFGCGQCGGSGCENLPGGQASCCSDIILIQDVRCNGTEVVAPCVIGTVDEVEGAAAEDTSAACIGRIGGGGGGGARRGGVALAVVGLAAAVAGVLF